MAPSAGSSPRQSGRKTSRTAAQSEDSRQRILDATIEIAAERGYEGTSISLVSQRSGFPTGSIYWHFGSKDGLLAAVIERSYQRWRADHPGGPKAKPTDAPPSVQLAGVLVRTLVGNPEFLRLGLMLTLESRPVEPTARETFLKFRAESRERLVATLRAAPLFASGPPDEQRCRDLVQLTMATMDGLFISQQVDGERADPGRLVALFIDAMVALVDSPAVRTAPPAKRASRTRR